MYCNRCGNQLPDDSQFCNRCGNKMKSAAERLRNTSDQQPPAPRPPAAKPPSPRPQVPRPPSVKPPTPKPPTLKPPPVKPPSPSSPPRPSRRAPIIESRPVRRIVQPPSVQSATPYRHEKDDDYDDQHVRRKNPRASDPQNDEIIFSINPAFYPVLFAYVISVLCSLLVASVIAYLKGSFWIVLVFAVIFLIPAIIRHIKLIRTVFTLTTTKLELSWGLFSTNSRNIPLKHIQDVSVSETFQERLLGIGDIIVDTAAITNKISMDNIKEPRKYADLILDQLHRWH